VTNTLNRKGRCFLELDDRRAVIPDLTPESLRVVQGRYQCRGHCCWHLSPLWHQHPRPIDVEVNSEPGTSQSDRINDISLKILDAAVVDVLAPYCRDIYFGRVTAPGPRGGSIPTRFFTVAAPKDRRVQSTRGRHCRHFITNCCGVVFNQIGWASGAIVERTLDDRLVYVDQDGGVLIADELVERLEFKRKFPNLWLYRIDVVPEPLDGEVLPGDPGWDGVFRPGPPPIMPEGRPAKGRVTLD
jgi:hypothetical protein